MPQRGVQRQPKKASRPKKTPKPVAVPEEGEPWAEKELAATERLLAKVDEFNEKQLDQAIEKEDVAKVAKLRQEVERRQARALAVKLQLEAQAELPARGNVAPREGRGRYSLAASDLASEFQSQADSGPAEGS